MKNLINTLLFIICLLIPFSMASQDYDIYRMNVSNGAIEQVTDLQNVSEYNPSFSNDGKFVVYDVVIPDAPFNVLKVTEIRTGVTSDIPGLIGFGNDASWSPNGKFIAFDGESPQGIYVVPFDGGTPQLVREYGTDADWSNNSRQLVFTNFNGEVITIDLATGDENVVANYGINPNWSTNGKSIVFSDGNNLFKIAVNQAGQPKGVPEQLTFDDRSTYNQQPSWSNNDKTIVFHSNRVGGDFDIWTISANGGDMKRLAGRPGLDDFDPAYSVNGRWVAFSSLTTPPAPVVEMEDNRYNNEDYDLKFTQVQTYPNPFSDIVFLRYELDETSEVSLQIFDAKGTLISTLEENAQRAGVHEIKWDGLTETGAALPAGRYTYSLITNKGQRTGQIIRIQSN